MVPQTSYKKMVQVKACTYEETQIRHQHQRKIDAVGSFGLRPSIGAIVAKCSTLPAFTNTIIPVRINTSGFEPHGTHIHGEFLRPSITDE